MNYHIDRDATRSAYLQLYHRLRDDIVSGAYPHGGKMPSKRQLADDAGKNDLKNKQSRLYL